MLAAENPARALKTVSRTSLSTECLSAQPLLDRTKKSRNWPFGSYDVAGLQLLTSHRHSKATEDVAVVPITASGRTHNVATHNVAGSEKFPRTLLPEVSLAMERLKPPPLPFYTQNSATNVRRHGHANGKMLLTKRELDNRTSSAPRTAKNCRRSSSMEDDSKIDDPLRMRSSSP